MNSIIRPSFVVACLVVVASVGQAQMRSHKFGIGVSGSYFLMQSDYRTAKPSGGGGLDLSYSLMEYLSVRSSLGVGFLQAKDPARTSLSTTLAFGNLYVAADFSPNGVFNPFVFVGGSGVYFDARTSDGTALTGSGVKRVKGALVGGVGFDIFANEFLSFTVAGEMALPYTDRLDGVVAGTKKDSYQRISLGIRYYFFDQDFITKMLKALEARYK
jgi:Outer membrane protein beta-barrel domain